MTHLGVQIFLQPPYTHDFLKRPWISWRCSTIIAHFGWKHFQALRAIFI